jgi:glycosyltransferase involved in cell wall biosynthesis
MVQSASFPVNARHPGWDERAEPRDANVPGILPRAKRIAIRPVRAALLRYARAAPSAAEAAGAERRLFILLWTAWGMGGTIRAAFNLAEYLTGHGYEVEIISAIRDRDEPFFGAFPAGVKVSVLDDRRPGVRRRALLPRFLRSRASLLIPNTDRAVSGFSLWTDLRLVRRLRGRAGFLLGTRPGVNVMIARLDAPGLTAIGLEQMNLSKHGRGLRRSMHEHYPGLAALVVLTERDRAAYAELLGGGLPLHRIPNTVRPLPGAKADLTARTVYAAGRFRYQKGFDLLIPAWAEIARAHPGWRLRLRGSGRLESRLRGLVAEHGLEDAVTLEGPAEDIGSDMAEASIFVLSSRFEGFPLILLEAMSKGMGVVSFDCPTGPADIVDDHRNGLLVPEEDVEGLARAIREMVEDEDLRRRTAAAAVETAQQYTIEAIGPLWLALLDELSRASRCAPAGTRG